MCTSKELAMAKETFENNSGCESSSHEQHLCYMISQGFHLADKVEYQALIKEPQFKCQKCGRLAASQINLCKPEKISPVQEADSEGLCERFMRFRSVNELLDAAIMREIQAQELYTKMAFMVENPWMSKVLEGFAHEERRHRRKLEAVRAGKITLEQNEIADVSLDDEIEDVKPHEKMDYLELLAYAINKEDKSYRFYTSLASKFSEPELKDIFLKLAQEEANHKQQLEIEYDSMKP
jgi:rubrerythrin